MNILRMLFPKKEQKGVDPNPEVSAEAEPCSIDRELQKLINDYGFATFPEALCDTKKVIRYKSLRTKEDLRLWSQDIMAYMVSMPDAQEALGMIIIATHQNLFYAGSYCCGDLSYADFKSIIPSLTDKLEELEPWNSPEQDIDGWYWYGIDSGCWLRVHKSIWQRFYHNARFYDHVARIRDTWSSFVLEANAVRTCELENTMSALTHCERVHDFTMEDAKRIEDEGIIAWSESDQGCNGLLCKDGKSYFRCTDVNYQFDIPIDQREEIKNGTLHGWHCYYCGLGHRVMVRDDFNKPFREKTYGLGKNAILWNIAFDVLCTILKEQTTVGSMPADL